MDEQKNNQDLTVGLDGAMTEGSSRPAPSTEKVMQPSIPTPPPPPTNPVVNKVAPPPLNEAVKPPEVANAFKQNSSSGVVKAPDDNTTAQNMSKLSSVPKTLDNSGSAADPSASNAAISHTSQNSRQKRPHEHRNNKKLAVAMVLLTAIFLSAAAIFVYISAQENTAPEQPVIEPITAPTEADPASNDPVLEDSTVNPAINSSEADPTLDPGAEQSPETTPAPPPASDQPAQDPVTP